MAHRKRPYEEWQGEERIPLEKVPERFPELDRNNSTLVRYCKVGVTSETGRQVILDCMVIPGRGRVTSIEAVRRFLDELNGVGVDLEQLAEAT
jgi:hypothetical protein